MCLSVRCQISENTPPTMWVERLWRIPESEPVGSRIIQVNGRDNEGGPLIYGLERVPFFDPNKKTQTNETKKIPFWINPDTGTVYLNESLQGRVSHKSDAQTSVIDK